jgi:lysozyme
MPTTPRLSLSSSGLDLIKSFEGFRAEPAPLPDGRWTYGFGHIANASPGAHVSQTEATSLLRRDLVSVEAAVQDWALTPLHQNAFDALVSLAFNIGLENYRDSAILEHLNAGEPIAAAAAFDAWRRARINGRLIVVDALVRRRAAEKALFLDHPGGPVAVPGAVVVPELDVTVAVLSSRDKAVSVTVPLNGQDASALTGFEPESEGATPVEDPEIEADADDQRPRSVATPREAVAAVAQRLNQILRDEPDPSDLQAALTGRAPEPAPSVKGLRLVPVEEDTIRPQSENQVRADIRPEPSPEPVVLPDTDSDELQPVERAFDPDPSTLMVNGQKVDVRDKAGFDPRTDPEWPRRSGWTALPWALVAMVSAALIAIGGYDWWNLIRTNAEVGQNQMLAAPLLILIGFVGLMIGLYYLLRVGLRDQA